jgi:hypothetical protein
MDGHDRGWKSPAVPRRQVGFEGDSRSNRYNGYRGFPERLTEIQEHPSVSWKDAGLPMKTRIDPVP